MKITDVRSTDLLFPHPEPFESCLFPGTRNKAFEVTLLEVVTDAGITGFSSNRDRWWDDPHRFSLSQPSYSKQIVDTYVHRDLIGKDPFKIVEHMQRMIRGLRMFHGYPWFVEFALWDIVGKAAGLPISRLWGGGRERIRAYASTAGLYSPAEMSSRLGPLLDRGFTAIKIRAHRADYRDDVAAMEAARDAVGPKITLMVDANQSNMPAYGLIPGAEATPVWDFRTALAFGKAVAALDFAWYEDPLPGMDMAGLADLRSRLDIPIAGAETEVGIKRYRELLQRGCFDIVQPDAAFSGGMLETFKVGALAEAHGVQCVPHIWGSPHSLAANLQLAATLPNCQWMECPHDPPGYPLEVRDMLLSETLGPGPDGYVAVPQGPGLGVDVNWDVVEAHRVT